MHRAHTPQTRPSVTRTAVVARLSGLHPGKRSRAAGRGGGPTDAVLTVQSQTWSFSPDGRGWSPQQQPEDQAAWHASGTRPTPRAEPRPRAPGLTPVLTSAPALRPSARTAAGWPPGRDNTARLWDVALTPAAAAHRPAGHEDAISAVAFSPDGRWLATGVRGQHRPAVGRRRPQRRTRSSCDGHEGDVYAVAFSPDGRWLATGVGDNTARLWDVRRPRRRTHASCTATRDGSMTVAFSPDGRWLATALRGQHGPAVGSCADPARRPIVLAGHEDMLCYAVAFSPDGRWLATGVRRQHRPAVGPAPTPPPPHASCAATKVASCRGLQPGWPLAGHRHRGQHRPAVGRRRPRRRPTVLRGHDGGIYAVAFSPDGRWLATGSVTTTPPGCGTWPTPRPHLAHPRGPHG